MVTKNILNEKLCEALANKPTISLWYSTVRAVIWDLLTKEGFNIPEALSYHWERQTVDFYLRDNERRFTVFTVKMKKAKGQSHYQYGQSWTDYSIKGFDIELYGANSLEEAIEQGQGRVAAQRTAQNKQYRDMEDQIRKIQEVLGLETPQQALRICEAISRNQYHLFKE